MNEYLIDIMNEVELTDEDWDVIMRSKRVAKNNRTYFDRQIWMSDTLDFEP